MPHRSSRSSTQNSFRNTLLLATATFAFTLNAPAQSPDFAAPSPMHSDFASSITALAEFRKADLPEAPQPQAPAATPEQAAAQSTTAPPASTTQQPDQTKSQHDLAEEQLKQEKKQRMGILPNFNASYVDNAVPLTSGQKFRLMFSTEKDPATFGFSMFIALIGQAEGSHSAYGGGIGG